MKGRFPRKRPDTEDGPYDLGIDQMAAPLENLAAGQERFLGDVAHELCSPVARAQLALGILEQRLGQSQHPGLADLQAELQTISNIINELLSFSAPSLDAPNIELTSVALGPLVEAVICQQANSQATFEIAISDTLCVLADACLLRRSIENLVDNAIRYAGAAGPISISAIRSVENVTLIVADSGPGIPEPALPHIFNPFYRVDPSRNRETGGVGLGLTIAKTCVEKCSGTVLLRNRLPHGLEATMTLSSISRVIENG